MDTRLLFGTGLLVALCLGWIGESHGHPREPAARPQFEQQQDARLRTGSQGHPAAERACVPCVASDSLTVCEPDNRLCVLIDDFEAHPVGHPPERWYTNKGRSLVPANEATLQEGSRMIRTHKEDGNRFVRMRMDNYAYRLIRVVEDSINWSVRKHPVLRWNWRVLDYPEGARETDGDRNDAAAAVYVTFGTDWLGRPKSIKYSYSSTLPVGTTTSYGPLKVLVVASAAEQPVGEWLAMERNVLEDYRRLFGEPPDTPRPTAITLFSDADSVPNASAIVDFDNVAAWHEAALASTP